MNTLESMSLSEELDKKIPRDMVELRDGGGGRKLSYLPGHYVIDRLNKVFGHLNWHIELTDVRQIENATPKGVFPAYLVKVRLAVKGPDGQLTIKEAYGYGSDKSSQNAHELAIKEARTDALKVAAKDLGMSMGLALYDKTQENVDDGETEAKPEGRPSEVRNAPAPKIAPVAGGSPAANPGPSQARGNQEGAADGATKLLELVLRYIKVARVQKKSEQTKDYFSKLGASSPEELSKLTQEQLQAASEFLKELTQ